MLSLSRALSAELLKTKRTLTLWLTLLAPLSLAFLELVMWYQQGHRMIEPETSPWLTLATHALMMWGLLLLPLFVTLEMGLLGAQEHGNKTWKQLYTTPLPRWTIYAAKQIIGLGVIALSFASLLVQMVGVGYALNQLRPALGFVAPIPWGDIAPAYALAFLAGWLIIALHLWVSLRWPSFVLAMGVGIVATVAGVLVIQSETPIYYPWILSAMVSLNLRAGDPVTIPVALGLAGGLLISLVGAWEVSRRDVL
jgi:lantibiotic transport system permease protein